MGWLNPFGAMRSGAYAEWLGMNMLIARQFLDDEQTWDLMSNQAQFERIRKIRAK
jgi:hypothetical protein